MKKHGVICAIDVNDYDQDVVDLAAEMARQFGVDLDLIHITLFPDPVSAASPAYLGSQSVMAGDHRRLLDIKTKVAGVEVHRHHLSGIPSGHVIGFVERNEPRLLVLGTHVRRGISRLLGSTAMKIMRKVTCPVMVLKQKQNCQSFAEVPSTS